MQKIALVFIGGGLGAAMRYLSTVAAGRYLGTGFPWGTLAVNLSGCFAIGVMLALAEGSELLSPAARLFAVTGFLGGLTTFSSYAAESVSAAQSGIAALLLNVAANNIAGLALVFCGLKAGKILI